MAVAPKHHTADQGVPTELRAGRGGLFRLRRAWPDRRHARSVDQRESVVYALTTRGDRRLAHTALDREDGVRGTRRHRADVRLTAKILHPHRRAADGHGPADPCRCCRPLAHLCSARLIVCAWRNAGGDRHRPSGRGRGCYLHGGGPAHRYRGNERPDDSVRVELGMVQVLSRLAVSAGVLAVAGLSGWLASSMPRQDVFVIGLIIPAFSVAGVFLRGAETMERRPIDWRILGGGIVFGVVVVVLGASGVPFGEEIIFVISLAVVCYMLVLVTAELDHNTRMGILFATIIVFAFRAAPTVGEGFFWWTLDELKFDAAFYGTLRQTGAILSIAVMWIFSRQLTEASVTKTLLWIAIASTILSLPNIALVYGVHHWTEAVFGFGARSIAFVDAAASSPFAQLSMVPLLTLIAYYAPPGHRATWFALMASLMNLAFVASQLQTKYLNDIFVVGRGRYAELGPLLIWAIALSFIIPVAAIALFGNRTQRHVAVKH